MTPAARAITPNRARAGPDVEVLVRLRETCPGSLSQIELRRGVQWMEWDRVIVNLVGEVLVERVDGSRYRITTRGRCWLREFEAGELIDGRRTDHDPDALTLAAGLERLDGSLFGGGA